MRLCCHNGMQVSGVRKQAAVEIAVLVQHVRSVGPRTGETPSAHASRCCQELESVLDESNSHAEAQCQQHLDAACRLAFLRGIV